MKSLREASRNTFGVASWLPEGGDLDELRHHRHRGSETQAACVLSQSDLQVDATIENVSHELQQVWSGNLDLGIWACVRSQSNIYSNFRLDHLRPALKGTE